jgi:hypothetical protein
VAERTTKAKLAFAANSTEKTAMSFTGTVKDGVVVLPPGLKLPDGLEVQLTVPDSAASRPFAVKGLKPFTKEEARRAFAPDPEWETLESAMSQRQIIATINRANDWG